MITIKDAEEKFQRCESCCKKKVSNITVTPENSNSSRGLHLCNDCLFLLVSKIKEYLNE